MPSAELGYRAKDWKTSPDFSNIISCVFLSPLFSELSSGTFFRKQQLQCRFPRCNQARLLSCHMQPAAAVAIHHQKSIRGLVPVVSWHPDSTGCGRCHQCREQNKRQQESTDTEMCLSLFITKEVQLLDPLIFETCGAEFGEFWQSYSEHLSFCTQNQGGEKPLK